MNATTATALVSGFLETNLKIIQRWPSSCHHDTPGNTRDQGQLLKQGLNSKLSARNRYPVECKVPMRGFGCAASDARLRMRGFGCTAQMHLQ